MAKEKDTNKLLNIYGARVSANGKYVNLSLVTGKDDARVFYCATIKKDNSSKVKVKEHTSNGVEGFMIFVPLLKADKKKEQPAELEDVDF